MKTRTKIFRAAAALLAALLIGAAGLLPAAAEGTLAVTASASTVTVGSKVTVKDIEFGDEDTFMLVGSTEADPDEGKISNESPLGQALLGQKSGSVIDVHAPAGIIKYEILAIKG